MFPRAGFAALLALALTPFAAHASDRYGDAPLAPTVARDSAEPAPVETVLTVLEGRVLDPDGSPAVGAVVLTSAGGRASTDEFGAFYLEVELGSGVEELQVTAVRSVGSAALTGSARVAIPALGAVNPVGTLQLSSGAGCQPDWLPTFGELPGTDELINALAVFDDQSGSGPALFVGGSFSYAGSQNAVGIAKWNGTAWSAVGTGTSGFGTALAVYDDGLGGGPALYVGGIGVLGGTVSGLARWNGTSWSAVPGIVGEVQALAVHDEGTGGGPKLFVGGLYSAPNGVVNIGRWNGSAWSTLSTGTNSRVTCLTTFDSGSGAALYAGGTFTTAGGVTVNRIARWSGGAWSALGTGTNGGTVWAMAAWGQGAGALLYVGGTFTQVNGQPAERLARWNGANWTGITAPGPGVIFSLAVHNDGSGTALYAGGSMCTGSCGVSRFNGTTWSGLSNGIPNGRAYALITHDDGSGSALFAAGNMLGAGLTAMNTPAGARHIARWNGSNWNALGTGREAPVYAFALHDQGQGMGPDLQVGGDFVGPSGGVASWNGSTFSALGLGLGQGGVRAILSFDDGTQSNRSVFVGGLFNQAGGLSAPGIARWNGTSWSSLAGGMNGSVHALASFDDNLGGDPWLFAGGNFTTAGGVPASGIARWTGSSWVALGSGLNNAVRALAVYNDGSGPALYVGGSFTTAGGAPANNIAKWNGTAWSAVGTGVNGTVRALTVHDDGSGPALYAGGLFSTAGGLTAPLIARWVGTWSALSGGGVTGEVRALASYDDGTGSGRALYVGGWIPAAGSLGVSGIACWRGGVWSSLGAGVQDSSVEALQTYDDGLGLGECLYVGGFFAVSSGGDSYLARWGRCASACTATLSAGSVMWLPQCQNLFSESLFVTTTGVVTNSSWTLTTPPDFPSNDGWSASVAPAGPQLGTLTFAVTDTSVSGSYDVVVRWDGVCNGIPVTASQIVTLTLANACPPGVPYCFGDGSGTACPCGNASASGAQVGCLSSLGLGGKLRATGSPSIANDSLVLNGTQMPTSSALYFQATAQQSGGAGALFGDGLRCTTGATIRLGTKVNGANGSAYPTGGDLSVSARGGVVAPGSRTYQIWYRNSAAFCTASPFNLTNGATVTWRL